jgi:hypothetical protein
VERDVYSSFSFVAHDELVLPNHRTNALDIVRIPTSAERPDGAHVEPRREFRPVLALGMPPLHPGMEILRSSCRGEPNPLGPQGFVPPPPASSSSPAASSPVREPGSEHQKEAEAEAQMEPEEEAGEEMHPSAPEDAIIMVNLFAQANQAARRGRPAFLGVPVQAWAFVVHRRALAECLAQWEHGAAAARGMRARGEAGKGAEQGEVKCPYVAWASWGPPMTRFFAGKDSPGLWITTTCGQRYVGVPERAWAVDGAGNAVQPSPERIRVWDFAKTRVKKMLWEKEDRDRERTVRRQEQEREQERKGKGKEIVVDRTVSWEDEAMDPVAEAQTDDEMGVEDDPEERMWTLPAGVDTNEITIAINRDLEDMLAEELLTDILTGAADSDEDFDADVDVDADTDMDTDTDEAADTDMEHARPRIATNRGVRSYVVDSPTVLPAAGVWEADVWSALPYVCTVSAARYAYQSVLVDEGRVIGLTVSWIRTRGGRESAEYFFEGESVDRCDREGGCVALGLRCMGLS